MGIPEIALSKLGKTYTKGCSGFVADVFDLPYKTTADYTKGVYIGKNGKYSGVKPGQIVGFAGHVAIYLGRPGMTFIDCPGQNEKVQTLNSYGEQNVYIYTYHDEDDDTSSDDDE